MAPSLIRKEVALVMMILRLNTLLKGHSGATLELRQLQFFINERAYTDNQAGKAALGASGGSRHYHF
ncbi:hypothetical protein ACVXZZ_06430 [Staphylococcus aureus]